MRLSKRFNILYNDHFLSCLSPWGKKTTRIITGLFIKNNNLFFKKSFYFKTFLRFISSFIKNILGG